MPPTARRTDRSAATTTRRCTRSSARRFRRSLAAKEEAVRQRAGESPAPRADADGDADDSEPRRPPRPPGTCPTSSSSTGAAVSSASPSPPRTISGCTICPSSVWPRRRRTSPARPWSTASTSPDRRTPFPSRATLPHSSSSPARATRRTASPTAPARSWARGAACTPRSTMSAGSAPATKKALLKNLGSLNKIRQASDADLLAVPGVTARHVSALRRVYAAPAPAEKVAVCRFGHGSPAPRPLQHPTRKRESPLDSVRSAERALTVGSRTGNVCERSSVRPTVGAPPKYAFRDRTSDLSTRPASRAPAPLAAGLIAVVAAASALVGCLDRQTVGDDPTVKTNFETSRAADGGRPGRHPLHDRQLHLHGRQAEASLRGGAEPGQPPGAAELPRRQRQGVRTRTANVTVDPSTLTCASGTPEFPAVHDMHIGIVSSSIGDFGVAEGGD